MAKQSQQVEEDDWFEGFGGAEIRGAGNFIAAGVYNIEILRLVRRVSQKPETKGHKLVILEGLIRDTLVSYEAEGAEYKASNKPGEKISWICNLTKQPELSMGELKALLLAALNYDRITEGEEPLQANDLEPEQWNEAVQTATDPPGEELAGKIVRAQASRSRSKRGVAITPPAWSNYQPGEDEESE